MPRLQAANNASTTLAGAITAAATSLTVASSTGFPAVPFRVTIDSEILEVTAVSTNTWTVIRGRDGTTAATHNDAVAIENRFTKGMYDELVGRGDLMWIQTNSGVVTSVTGSGAISTGSSYWGTDTGTTANSSGSVSQNTISNLTYNYNHPISFSGRLMLTDAGANQFGAITLGSAARLNDFTSYPGIGIQISGGNFVAWAHNAVNTSTLVITPIGTSAQTFKLILTGGSLNVYWNGTYTGAITTNLPAGVNNDISVFSTYYANINGATTFRTLYAGQMSVVETLTP